LVVVSGTIIMVEMVGPSQIYRSIMIILLYGFYPNGGSLIFSDKFWPDYRTNWTLLKEKNGHKHFWKLDNTLAISATVLVYAGYDAI